MIAETENDQIKRLNEWKDNVASRGMRVNMNKTKVITLVLFGFGMHGEVTDTTVVDKWRKSEDEAEGCGDCGRGVGSNSTQCTSCQKWVHKKCSGIKSSMSKVM